MRQSVDSGGSKGGYQSAAKRRTKRKTILEKFTLDEMRENLSTKDIDRLRIRAHKDRIQGQYPLQDDYAGPRPKYKKLNKKKKHYSNLPDYLQPKNTGGKQKGLSEKTQKMINNYYKRKDTPRSKNRTRGD